MTQVVKTSLLAFSCLFFVVLSLFLSVAEPQRQSLNGKWRLSNNNGSVCLSAEVPGCVHSALQLQGFIQDPYFRFNDAVYRWIALENWTYTTTFTVSAVLRAKQKVLLIFEGMDTVAFISLNGITIGETDNMFCEYDFSVRDQLKVGDNELRVDFLSPVRYAAEKRKAHPYRVPPDCPPDVQRGECHVNFIRKVRVLVEMARMSFKDKAGD